MQYYEAEIVAQTTEGIQSIKADAPLTEGELRDSLAGWLGFDWVLEVHITRFKE
jgi:hypothetical protein